MGKGHEELIHTEEMQMLNKHEATQPHKCERCRLKQ